MEPPYSWTRSYEPAFSRAVPVHAPRDRYWLHALLFVATLGTTIAAGGWLAGRTLLYGGDSYDAWIHSPYFWLDGLRYALSLLGFLTVHEFGHYFAARYHRINTSLPYYIPFPPPGPWLPVFSIGTFGAVIRIREPIPGTRRLFDVGAAGPLAGFVVALAVLLVALATLPPPTYLLDLDGHEALKAYIQQYERFPPELLPRPEGLEGLTIVVGQTPLFWLLSQFFSDVPPMYEIYHYPMLFAGWLGLFFTALNLLPVGQLDGGHILYALVGPRWHRRLARGFVTLLLASASIGFAEEMPAALAAWHPLAEHAAWLLLAVVLFFFLNRVYQRELRIIGPLLIGIVALASVSTQVGEPLQQFGYTGWFLWCLLIVWLIKVDHPPVLRPEPLTPGRKALGILSILIFLLCFSLKPLYLV